MAQNLITEDLETVIQKILAFLKTDRIKTHIQKGGFNPSQVSIKTENKYITKFDQQSYTFTDQEKVLSGITIKIGLNNKFENQIHVFIPCDMDSLFFDARKITIIDYDSERPIHIYPKRDGYWVNSDNAFYGERCVIEWQELKRTLCKQFDTYWALNADGKIYEPAFDADKKIQK